MTITKIEGIKNPRGGFSPGVQNFERAVRLAGPPACSGQPSCDCDDALVLGRERSARKRKARAVTATTTISDKERAVIYAELAKAVNRLAGTMVKDRYTVDVLRFVADRTFGFQKLSEVILERHFLNGVQSAAKGVTCAGLGMSAAKLYACLHWAREQGIVVTTKAKRKVRYAIKLEWLLALVSPKTRDKIAPALGLTDNEWGADEPREHLHAVEVSAPGYLHEVEVHLKKHYPYGVIEEESSARELAPDAGPGSFSFSGREEGASAPLPVSLAAAPAVAVQPAPPTAAPIQVVPAASPAERVAKRGRVPRELWGSTLSNRFDAARREAWPEAGLPPEPSIKLRKQWEHVATHWRRTDVGPGDWVEWCVKNWRTIYLTVFRHVEHTQEREAAWRAEAPSIRRRQWREDMVYPEYPDFDFLRKYRKAFESEWDRRGDQMVRTDLLPGAKWLRQLLRNGWPMEDAQREVDARLAKRKFVEDLEARERKLNEAAYRLQLKEQDIDNRIAIGRSYRTVQPVARERAKPKFATEAEIFAPFPPLPPSRAFKDHHDDPD